MQEADATMKVRPLSYEDVFALAQPDAEPIEAYQVVEYRAHGQVLVKATLRPRPKRRHAEDQLPHEVIYEMVPNPRNEGTFKPDTTKPVGYKVKLSTHDMFGSHSERTVYSSEAAEQNARLMGIYGPGGKDPSQARLSVAIPDDQGVDVPLIPLYGAESTVGLIVRGLSPEDLAIRLEKALKAEFGDALRMPKLKTRPAADVRVNVYDFDNEKPVAINILKAEVSSVFTNGCRVEEVDPDMLIGR